MSEHRDNATQADEEALLRRWYAASSLAEPLPTAELLELGEQGHRARRRRQNLAVAAVAVVAIVAGIAGVGAWANHRGSAVPAAPTGTATSSASAAVETTSPTLKAPDGFALAEHEYILQVHRANGGGWLLTTSRLLVTDGASWRACWTSTASVPNGPQPQAIVSGRTVRVFEGETMWTSTDGCATWAQAPMPVPAMGAAFPTGTTGYIAYDDNSTPNAALQIFRTTDGGAHWTATDGTAQGYVGPGLPALAFADADHGWLTDDYGGLWSTANGGATWTKTALPVPASVSGKVDIVTAPIVAADGQAVMTAKYDTTPGMDGAKGQWVIYRTIDRGTHWVPVKILDDPGSLLLFGGEPSAWVALDPSDPATVQTSTDFGVTWKTVTVRERWPFTAAWFMTESLSFADALHGWMVVQEPPPPCPKNTICDYAFAPANHLVATDDGGVTWHQVDP